MIRRDDVAAVPRGSIVRIVRAITRPEKALTAATHMAGGAILVRFARGETRSVTAFVGRAGICDRGLALEMAVTEPELRGLCSGARIGAKLPLLFGPAWHLQLRNLCHARRRRCGLGFPDLLTENES